MNSTDGITPPELTTIRYHVREEEIWDVSSDSHLGTLCHMGDGQFAVSWTVYDWDRMPEPEKGADDAAWNAWCDAIADPIGTHEVIFPDRPSAERFVEAHVDDLIAGNRFPDLQLFRYSGPLPGAATSGNVA